MKVKLANPNFYNNFVENLLKFRGIQNVADYMQPTKDYLQPPDNLKNIGAAAALYTRVVLNDGKILIVVDSDVDGYTSAAIMYQYTKRLNPNCTVEYWLHEG